MDNLGNQLNRIVYQAQNALFEQGELSQLTYGAFDIAARTLKDSEKDEIELSYPIGYRADKTTIEHTYKYSKDELLGKYQYLALHQLSVNGLFHLVTVIEAMLNDVVRATVLKYPKKLSKKRNVPMKDVLECTSLEEVHMRATDGFINDLSYQSPVEFAESIQSILSLNLLECPAFHKYVEVKATRDIFIHNLGIANEVYIRKSGSHARVKAEMELPADIQYYLESYEACLQMVEWLENELHQSWHSAELEERIKKPKQGS